ncbi:uncharacterized protein LOC108213104 [Daucus carota subsp. sativus]|uniref:uncharacterized protein LOC108213104 n=1 Tax=Daucus carota subsp. sativus TaxID=79200 RepID=UPI003083C67F
MDLDTLYADALAGDAEAIAELEKKADRLSQHDRTILHVESMYGHPERVRSIMKMFEQIFFLVKLDTFKQTALHLAADHGHTEVVELLIDAARALSSPLGDDDIHDPVEAFIRRADEKMSTALHLAVSNHHMGIVKLIVEPDPRDRHIQNCNYETPIYIAAKLGYTRIVIYDRHYRPHKIEKYKHLSTAKELWKAAKRSACHEDAPYNSFEALFYITDQDGHNVLQLAVMGNNKDAVELILKEDPEYHHKRSNKNSDLKSLAYIAAEKRYKDIVKLVCETYEARNEIGHWGQTTLHAAIIGRDADTALVLLRRNRHLVTWEDHRGWTPLHYAAYYGFDEIILEMLDKQDEVAGYQFVPRENIPPPFFVAVEQGHLSTVQLYMFSHVIGSKSVSADVNFNGQNILHFMAWRLEKTNK